MCKLNFEYITLILLITHYNKTNHICIVNIYIYNYISPKQYPSPENKIKIFTRNIIKKIIFLF